MINKILNKFNIKINRIYPRASIKFAKEHFGDAEIVAVEIGVFKGENALSMLKTLNIKKLYLIDPYIDLGDAEKEAKKKLKPYEDKIVWIRDKSRIALLKIPNKVDLIYIDGNHAHPYIDDDIENYFPKVMDHGILAGHDIENGRSCTEHTDVIEAFMDFILHWDLKPYIQSPDWWIVKGEKQ